MEGIGAHLLGQRDGKWSYIPYLIDALQEIDTRISYRSVIHPLATDDQILEELYKLMTMSTRVSLSVGVKPHVPRLKELESFKIRWKRKIQQEYPTNERFELNIFGLWAYDAAYGLAMAVEKLGPTNFSFQKFITSRNSTDRDTIRVSQIGPNLLQSLLSTRFKGLSGDFQFFNRQLRSSAFQSLGQGWFFFNNWYQSLWVIMGTVKFDVEKFTGKNDFGLWRLKMRALLVQQGLQDALLGEKNLPNTMQEKHKIELLEKAHGAIILSLGDTVLREVAKAKSAAKLLLKLESLYMTKSLANRLHKNIKLYTFKMTPNASYTNMKEAIMYGRDILTFDEVQSILHARELHKQEESKEELEVDSGKEWILDSGCSFHMCPIKAWFEDFKEANGGHVLLGNNKHCKILGTGTVKIKHYDGIERVLEDIRYIPELKMNLISLGMLDKLGYTFKSEPNSLRVARGSLTVMKVTIKNELYTLIGLDCDRQSFYCAEGGCGDNQTIASEAWSHQP
ncbi:Glutamate receptor 2.1 [Vitis vinifera]|uniref:Glutamate receptor 2.1 n=1 Tax=Vitis vinifera TaxID=29760 RepID=A0A438CUM9_VITVI|nr:Glutamate receptor 2.1 [Vitis vinifera]